MGAQGEPRSAYLHIPFCHRRCFYCDFPVVPLGDHANGGESKAVALYLQWLEHEIATSPPGSPLSTVYLGGGTPSLLSPSQIGRLLDLLARSFGLAPGVEITLELDPASFDEPRLRGYRAAGVTRASLGVQSFDNDLLAAMGRRHSGQDSDAAMRWVAAAGFSSWSVDVIAGLPGLTPAVWDDTLSRALAFGPPHLSVYDLTIESGTVFARRQQQGMLPLPDEGVSAAMLDRAAERLQAVGMRRYEISSYALPGHAARHNRVYWSGGDWWAFGMGATSSHQGQRVTRPRTRRGYRDWLGSRERSLTPPVTARERLEDLLITGLRRSEGVHRQWLARQCGLPPNALMQLPPPLRKACAEGLLCVEGPYLRLLQPDGFRLSNRVLEDCLSWAESLCCGSAAARCTSLPAQP